MKLKVEKPRYMPARIFKTVPDAKGKPQDVYVGSLSLDLLSELLLDGDTIELVIDDETKRRIKTLASVGIISARVRAEKH